MQEKDQFILDEWGISQKWWDEFLMSLCRETPFEKSGFQQYVISKILKDRTPEQVIEQIESKYKFLANKMENKQEFIKRDFDNINILKEIYEYGIKSPNLNIEENIDKLGNLEKWLNPIIEAEAPSVSQKIQAPTPTITKKPYIEESENSPLGVIREEEDDIGTQVQAAAEIGRPLSRRETEEKESPKTQVNETVQKVEVKIPSKTQESNIDSFLSTSSGRASGLVARGRAKQLARKNDSEGKLPILIIAKEAEEKKSEEKMQGRSTTPDPVPFSAVFRTIPLPKPKQRVAPKADPGLEKQYPLRRRDGYIEVLKREARTPSPPDRTHSPVNIKSSRPL